MSDPLLPPDQRSFHCPSCDGRIVVPASLPATTGPCPHCQVTITSPAPESENQQEETQAVEVKIPPASSQTPTPEENTPPAPVEPAPQLTKREPTKTEEPAPAEPFSEKEKEKEKEKEPDSEHESDSEPDIEDEEPEPAKRSKKLLVVLLLLVVLPVGGIAVFTTITGTPVKSIPDKILALLNQEDVMAVKAIIPVDPNEDSKEALKNYLNAATVEAKLPHILNAEELRPEIESFYQNTGISEADRGISTFTLIQLPREERAKGLLLYASIPVVKDANAKTDAPSKILAFFKETDGGPKLDWEVFTQTKHRTFRKFYETPKSGTSGMFRVLVKQIPPPPSDTASGTQNYRLIDPANISDTVDIAVEPDSTAGREFSSLMLQEPGQSEIANARPVTVELEWTESADSPKLQLKRFVCWEFVNLGGSVTSN